MDSTPITPSTPLRELRARILSDPPAPVPMRGRIRELVRRHDNARSKNWNLSDIVVTNDGRIATAQEESRGVTVSRVTTEIFAAVPWDEEALVRQHLPASTRREGHGWVYTITTEYEDTFVLFLHHDEYQRQYRVQLIAPAVEELGDAHKTHVYGDGHLCLSPSSGGGQHMLNNAYAESVLWCTGIGAVARGHDWPWGE